MNFVHCEYFHGCLVPKAMGARRGPCDTNCHGCWLQPQVCSHDSLLRQTWPNLKSHKHHKIRNILWKLIIIKRNTGSSTFPWRQCVLCDLGRSTQRNQGLTYVTHELQWVDTVPRIDLCDTRTPVGRYCAKDWPMWHTNSSW